MDGYTLSISRCSGGDGVEESFKAKIKRREAALDAFAVAEAYCKESWMVSRCEREGFDGFIIDLCSDAEDETIRLVRHGLTDIAGGVKARGRCGNGDSGRLSHPSNSLRVGLGTLRPLKARKSLLLGGNGGTDLPGFPTFRQAPGQSRNPPPIGMLKTPSSRETIGRRRGKAGHAAAAR